MKTTGIVGIVVILVALLGLQVMHFRMDRDRQRQIDQLCAVIPQMIQSASPQMKIYSYNKLPHGVYGVYFVNYNGREAIFARGDGKKDDFYYVVGIPRETLENLPRTLEISGEESRNEGRNKGGVKESKSKKMESKLKESKAKEAKSQDAKATVSKAEEAKAKEAKPQESKSKESGSKESKSKE